MESATRLGAVSPVSSRETVDADFAAWMSARQPALQRTAYLLTGGDRHAADDLVAGALAKMYLSWARVRDVEHLDAYARKVLLNEHRSSYRRPWRRRETPMEVLPERASTPAAAAHDESLWRSVCALPPRQRQVIVLRYYEELTEAETAQLLGISVGTVKSQAFKALRSLRGVLDADQPHTDLAEEER